MFKKLAICVVSAGLAFGGAGIVAEESETTKSYDQSELYKFHLQKLKTKNVISENALYDSRVLDMYEAFTGAIEDRYLMQKLYSEEDVRKIMSAAEFAAKKHKGQKRKNKEKTPYIIHPIGVANQIMTIAKVFEPEVIIAALLHDTLEDTATTKDEIKNLFGEKVLSIVEEVTDDISLTSDQKKLQQVFHAPHLSDEAALVKTSDRLYNVRDTKTTFWSDEKIDKYFLWASKLVKKLPRVSEDLIKALEDEVESHFGKTS